MKLEILTPSASIILLVTPGLRIGSGAAGLDCGIVIVVEPPAPRRRTRNQRFDCHVGHNVKCQRSFDPRQHNFNNHAGGQELELTSRPHNLRALANAAMRQTVTRTVAVDGSTPYRPKHSESSVRRSLPLAGGRVTVLVS